MVLVLSKLLRNMDLEAIMNGEELWADYLLKRNGVEMLRLDTTFT